MGRYISASVFKSSLTDKNKKIIAWGTGSYYQMVKDALDYKLPIAYFVDNKTTHGNSMLDGSPIFSPTKLLAENPHEIIIIVFSMHYAKIVKQINEIGDFSFGSGSALLNIPIIDNIQKNLTLASGKKRPTSKNAIIIQGGIDEMFTIASCQLYATFYPHDTIILSTWEDEDPQVISMLKKYVDIVILNKKPAWHGSQNRNMQIESTKNALLCAKDLNLETAVKTRADMLMGMPDIFRLLTHISNCHDSQIAREHGLKGRILIPSMYTRVYMNYHISDMFMLGYVDDILKVWDIPLDNQKYDISDPVCKEELFRLPYEYCMKHYAPPECYIAQHFCRNINRKLEDTYTDHLRFIRDFFVVYDEATLHLIWYKNPLYFSNILPTNYRTCMSHDNWLTLINVSDFQEMFPPLDTSVITFGEFLCQGL